MPLKPYLDGISRALFLCVVLSFLHGDLNAQAANNTCATAQTISVNPDCTPTAGDLYAADLTNPGGCGNRRDVWYRFTQPTNCRYTTVTVTLTSATTTLTTANVSMELFNSSTCPVTGTLVGACQNISQPRTYSGLTGGNVYYLRINTSQNTSANPGNWNFNICLQSQDTTTQAVTIAPGTT